MDFGFLVMINSIFQFRTWTFGVEVRMYNQTLKPYSRDIESIELQMSKPTPCPQPLLSTNNPTPQILPCRKLIHFPSPTGPFLLSRTRPDLLLDTRPAADSVPLAATSAPPLPAPYFHGPSTPLT